MCRKTRKDNGHRLGIVASASLPGPQTCRPHVLHCQRARCANHLSTDTATLKPETHVGTSIFAARSCVCLIFDEIFKHTWENIPQIRRIAKRSPSETATHAQHIYAGTITSGGLKTSRRSYLCHATDVPQLLTAHATSALAAIPRTPSPEATFPKRMMTVFLRLH